jgi:hypothetical protein
MVMAARHRRADPQPVPRGSGDSNQIGPPQGLDHQATHSPLPSQLLPYAVLSIHLPDNHKIALIRIRGGTHADKYK